MFYDSDCTWHILPDRLTKITGLNNRLPLKGLQSSMNNLKITKVLLAILIGIVANPAFSGFKFPGSDVTINPNGRLLTDVAWYSHSDNIFIGDGTQVRSFRLGARGQICPICQYNVSVDFGRANTSLRDVVLSFDLYETLRLHIGQYKPPISLEFLDSSLSITFLERALPNVFVTSRRIGAGFNYQYPLNYGASVTYAAGGFTESANNSATPATNQAYNFSNRLNLNQEIRDDIYWLMGAGFSYTQTDSANTMRYAPRPESTVTDVRLVDTGVMSSVKSASLSNLEFAMQYHRLSLQAEYFYNYLDRNALESLSFDGYYAYASFFFTDDFRPLNAGESRHGRVKPTCQWGALEGTIRYSHINLDDRDVQGGKESNVTLGLNWYLNSYIRFMTDYIRASARLNGEKAKTDVYTIRAQLDFS